MSNEATATDQYVRETISKFISRFSEQQADNPVINSALKHASKQGKNGPGKPDFFFMANDYPVFIEDKPDVKKAAALDSEQQLILKYPEIAYYADNGAVWYAKQAVENSVYKESFAIGAAGTREYILLQPYYVSNVEGLTTVKTLNPMTVDTIINLSPSYINEYYRVEVEGEKTKEQQQIEQLQDIAAQLHEDLRNYASLEGENKATVVSALLLALSGDSDLINSMDGTQDPAGRDGDKVFVAIERKLNSSKVRPKNPNANWDQKIQILLNKFSFIKTNVMLNQVNTSLGMTPLRYFGLTLDQKVLQHLTNNTDFDILGNFYGEFVKYGGSDGNSLGIVLTPRHITSLMSEIVDIQPEDYVLDPACGSAGFLISAMHRMLLNVETESERTNIRQNHLYGIELQEKLFTVATTNMILRGDGKSNLRLGDMFAVPGSTMQAQQINKILFNPPYSQAKNKQTQGLSELSFINHALSMSIKGGKLAAIVPQSAMIGKNKFDKNLKKCILADNTLDAVITLNPNTFYGIGVNPVISVFTAGIPHDANKKVLFVDFKDDGYYISKHIGLTPDGTENEKRYKLIQLLKGNILSFSTDYALKTTITADDEWLHSYFYFNDQIPSPAEFRRTIEDYLSFVFDMVVHGKKGLFNYDDR